MNRIRYFLLLFFALLAGSTASAQFTITRDSVDFDDRHGRLREIDFEDFYSVTVDRVLYRNPWGLHAMAIEDPDDEGNYPDTADVFLWIGQGATLDFPTRTRRVELDGYANLFYVHVTDFNDSTFVIGLTEYPVSVGAETGIKRIQLFGTDGNSTDLDINWSGGLLGVTTFDENDDTLSSTDFDELEPGHYYLLGRGLDARVLEHDSLMFAPTEWHGVTFTELNYGIQGTHLSLFEARVDPDNPIGNLSLEITPDATIDFAEGTEGALIVLEQVQLRDTFFFEVTDWAGNRDTVMDIGWGREYDTTWVEDQRATYLHLGFSADSSLKQIRFLGGWTAEINEFSGDTSYYGITAMLTAVHVAEEPVTEINGISMSVGEIDSAGFLDDTQDEALRGALAKATGAASRGDRGEAVRQLETFRREVATLHEANVLVDEEAKLLGDDAAYVIMRLGGVSAIRSSSDISAGLSLATTNVGADGIRFDIATPTGSSPTVRIVDLRGSIVRTIELESGTSTYLWDRRDDTGRDVASGVYLVTLVADGKITSSSVRVMR